MEKFRKLRSSKSAGSVTAIFIGLGLSSIYFGGCISSGGSDSSGLGSQQQGAWSARSPMPTPRMELGVAEVEGIIYAIGGYSGSTLAVNEAYNPATDMWETKASMPTPRRLHVVAEANGKIYAIGGASFTGESSCTATYSFANEEYDPLTDTWTSKADLPMDPPSNNCIGNAFIGGSSVNGKIYIFVFNTAATGLTETYEYDPLSDTWDKSKSPVPFSYTRFSAASVNGKIYVLATDPPIYWNSNFMAGAPFAVYDPIQDIWVVMPSTNVPRRLMSLTGNADGLFAIGGLSYAGTISGIATFTETPSVESFVLVPSQWQEDGFISTGRHSAGAIMLDGTIYVIGGGTADYQPLSVVEAASIP